MPDDKKPQAPNLDLIQMVQRARMQHDADAVPSEVAAVYWIECKADVSTAAPTPRAGAWVIETDVANVDAVWDTVKRATRAGQLGYKSKVSTASRKGERDSTSRAILVCTADRADAADCARVRDVLEGLGLAPLRYE